MWKDTVNGALRKVVGHELVRAATADARRAPAPKPQTKATPKPAPKVEKEKKRPPIPDDFDAEARAILRRVKPRTMTPWVRIFGLVEATRYVVDHDVPGAIVECGVWRGGSMQAVALTLADRGVDDRELHLFDTFEGMPPPTEEDRRGKDGRSAAELLEATTRDHNVWAYATLDDVRRGMTETGYPAERIHYHQGLVEETVPAEAPEQIAILRLDTDWYASTKHELEHLFDRLSPGGVLIIDDYGHWEGARKAVDEWRATLAEPLLLLPLGGGRIALRR